MEKKVTGAIVGGGRTRNDMGGVRRRVALTLRVAARFSIDPFRIDAIFFQHAPRAAMRRFRNGTTATYPRGK